MSSLIAADGKKPHLAAILVGTDGASETYVSAKVRACKEVGFSSTLVRLDNKVLESDLLSEIEEINNNYTLTNIINLKK